MRQRPPGRANTQAAAMTSYDTARIVKMTAVIRTLLEDQARFAPHGLWFATCASREPSKELWVV